MIIICSGVDVEVGDEASEDVFVFVGTVDLDLGMVVTKGCERGDQPIESIGVLITSAVGTWIGGGKVLSIEINGGLAAFSSKEHIDIVSNNVGISVEDDIEIERDKVSNLRGVGLGSTSGNIIDPLGIALSPGNS